MTEQTILDNFLNKKGIDLLDKIPDDDMPSSKVERYYNLNKDLIVTYIQTFNHSYEFVSTPFIEDIILDQMEWMLLTYNFTNQALVDLFNNSVNDITPLLDRYIKPLVKIKLKNSGLCFRGL